MLNKPAYRIFISSTARDLRNIRRRVANAIQQAGHIPLSMESWPSATTRTLDVIRDEIDQCDILVSIVGCRYGNLIEDQDCTDQRLSYTEFEFQHALKLGRPILAFLLADEHVNRQRSQLAPGDPERRCDEELRLFRDRIQRTAQGEPRLVSFFKNEADIVMTVTNSLLRLMNSSNFHAPGLIPRDLLEDESGLRGLYSTPFIEPTLQRLTGYALLFDRVQEQKSIKRELAKFFWHYCFPGILDAGIFRLFFESGSTLAYVADRFLNRASEDRSWQDYCQKVSVTTNNLLVFLQFLFTSTTLPIELRPQGRPDEKYGATYGPIESLVSKDPPLDEPLDKKASNAAEELVTLLMSPGYSQSDAASTKPLILAATSGVNCEDSPRGPHVGSYRNKIFKRALLMTGAPIVFFLDESKFFEESKLYSPSRCFAVCGKHLTWDYVLRKRSIAFCVGASTPEKRKTIAKSLHSLGLTFSSKREPRGDYGCLPFLMANQRFVEEFRGIPLWSVDETGLLI